MLVLKDVLYVPQFKFNLISISALTCGSNLTINFLPDCCSIQEHNTEKMIGKGDKFEDLYVLDKSNLNSVSTTFVNTVPAHIWHSRLVHASFGHLDTLKHHLHCDGSRLNKADLSYICPLAKQRRLSFDSHNHTSQFPFDLVHCDVWGPYHVPSHAGHRFFLTSVDDCTRFTLIYLLKQKSDVGTVILKFFNMISTQFNTKINAFR